jgi:hypothetical protein
MSPEAMRPSLGFAEMVVAWSVAFHLQRRRPNLDYRFQRPPGFLRKNQSSMTCALNGTT